MGLVERDKLSEVKQKINKLTMAATHLGNLQDIPSRSLQTLREADLLVFEEDRPARAVLKAAGVHRDYLKYSEHDQEETLETVARMLKGGGWVSYMSDQGMPGMADPGRQIVALAYQLGIPVEVIPGPSSVTVAIAAAPFDCSSFHFLGFPPREGPQRAKALREAAAMGSPVILMDAPYRLATLLAASREAFGRERRGLLALDISGPHEAFWCASLDQLGKRASSLTEKLNFILVIEGR